MNKNSWAWLGAFVVVVIIIIAVVHGGANKADANVVKIGFVGPLTGDAAAYGATAQEGAQLAVSDINAAGGINGKKVEVIFEDGKCTGQDAVSAMQKLVSIDKVKFILGGACSGETLAMGPVAQSTKTLIFSSVSSSPDISKLGDYVFRNHPSDDVGGANLAAAANARSKKAAIISEETDYAQGIRKVFSDDYTQAGGQIVDDETFVTGTTDFRSIISKVKASGADAIFVNAQTEAAAVQIATQIRQLGLKTQLYGIYFTGDQTKKSPAMDGIIMVDLPSLLQTPASSRFLSEFNTMFGKGPEYHYFAAATYDALNLLVNGIKSAGYNPSKVSQYLYGIQNYDGVAGTYHFDQNGDVVGISFTLKQLKNGQFVPLQ